MTKVNFKKIVRELELAYIRDNFFKESGQIDLWYEMLGDVNEEILRSAIRNYIAKNVFQPTIADIKSEYNKIVDEYNTIKYQLKEIYDRTRGTYPDIHSNTDEETRERQRQEAMQAWWDLVKVCPLNERVRKAEEIESATIQFVRSVEADPNRQKIPTLAEFFRGAR